MAARRVFDVVRRGISAARRGFAKRGAAQFAVDLLLINQQLIDDFKTFSSVKQFVSRKFCKFHGDFYVPRPPPVDFLSKK